MASMSAGAALAVLLLFIPTVEAALGDVTFWKEEFTMTCPGVGQWTIKKIKNETAPQRKEYTDKYENDMKGPHICEYNNNDNNNQKYYFYVQGKVCPNCYELDGLTFMLAIVADLLMTISVMFIMYKCTKRKRSSGPSHTPKPPARQGGRGPPVPSPDYEHLNPHTRSHDTYSIVNRTG